MRRRAVARSTLLTCLAVVLAVLAAEAPLATAHSPERIELHRWRTHEDFRSGTAEGTTLTAAGLRIDRAGTHRMPDGRCAEQARWTTPMHRVPFPATELIASWNAETPAGTWISVDMRGENTRGERSGWYQLGLWASGDRDIRRTSIDGQSDEFGSVSVDTFAAASRAPLLRYQLRVTLHRLAGTHASPTVTQLAATSSALPTRQDGPHSRPGPGIGIELPAPRYAQNIHKGHFPEYGGGGEAWCSPTSTEMVIEYWGRRPSERDLSWIEPGHVDPTVDHAARSTYDLAYDGTGNWPFNTAYAATFGLDAVVTRFASLTEAEEQIRRGVPVITSQSFRADELPGAPYDTEGHIMVIVGFTAEGDVIVHDPAADSNEEVRTVYPREQFERVWQRTQRWDEHGELASGPGGVVYLIQPAGRDERHTG